MIFCKPRDVRPLSVGSASPILSYLAGEFAARMEPGLVLEIFRDRLHGWALSQARLAGNKPVPEPLREEIVRELRSMGVTVDRTLWHLDDALDDIVLTPSTPVRTRAAAIGDMFGD